MSDRRAVLYAALACTRVTSAEPEIRMVRFWLDSWIGLGLVVVGC